VPVPLKITLSLLAFKHVRQDIIISDERVSTMTSVSQTYSSLRSDLHHQENNTEIALAEFSSLINSPPSQQETRIEDRLLQLFADRRETLDSMARLVDNDPSSGGARVHQISRAREILVEHEKEFRRMKVPSFPPQRALETNDDSLLFSRREIEKL